MNLRTWQIILLVFCTAYPLKAQEQILLDSTYCKEIVALVYADEYTLAINELDSLQSLQQSFKPSYSYVKLLIDVGSAFNEKGEYGLTLQYFFLALNVAKQERYEDLEAESLIGIGYSYYFLEQLVKGMEYAQRAQSLSNKLGLRQLEGTSFNLLGILEEKSMHDPQVVLDQFNKALAIRTELGDVRGIASTLSNIALVKEREEKFDEALSIQKKSLQIDESIGNEYGSAWSYQMIGELLVKMNRFEEADQYLELAEDKSKRLRAKEIMLQTYRSKSQSLAKQRKFEDALMFSEKYNGLRDSIYNAGLSSKVSSLQQGFETRERDKRIAQQQEAITWQKRLFVGGLIMMLLIFFLLVFYYKSYKESRQLNKDITERNEEIQAQAEELTEANQSLLVLNKRIDEQNEELEAQAEELLESNQLILSLNEQLNSDIELKKNELYKTNEELIKHNSELLQFSFTVSHNLRGPVARMLGLMNLIEMDHRQEERENLIQLLKKSTFELDVILRDLGLIIDSRHALSRIKEKVYFEDEWNKCLFLLGDNIQSDFVIKTNFTQLPYLYTVRAMIQNVFYNLLSNAIRYRSPERNPTISIETYEQDDRIFIMISDNGLGIDLSRHNQDIFKLYKRFHPHINGKGLGLYLVKTQIESLGGSITVESELNKGTCFKITLPVLEMMDEQILLETDGVKLYYDANINNTVILWKRPVTGDEYRQVFETVLQTLQIYNTPGWIADLRNQGIIPEAERKWFMEKVLLQAVGCGLKRIATVGFTDPIRKDYYVSMQHYSQQLGVELQVFGDLKDAKQWMESFMLMGQSTYSTDPPLSNQYIDNTLA